MKNIKILVCYVFIILTVFAFSGCSSTYTIITNPEGANITVNKAAKGLSPFFVKYSNMRGRSVALIIQKKGYKTINTTLDSKGGIASFNLEKITKILTNETTVKPESNHGFSNSENDAKILSGNMTIKEVNYIISKYKKHKKNIFPKNSLLIKRIINYQKIESMIKGQFETTKEFEFRKKEKKTKNINGEVIVKMSLKKARYDMDVQRFRHGGRLGLQHREKVKPRKLLRNVNEIFQNAGYRKSFNIKYVINKVKIKNSSGKSCIYIHSDKTSHIVECGFYELDLNAFPLPFAKQYIKEQPKHIYVLGDSMDFDWGTEKMSQTMESALRSGKINDNHYLNSKINFNAKIFLHEKLLK